MKFPKKMPLPVFLIALLGTSLMIFALSLLGASILNLLRARYLTQGSLITYMFWVILLGLPLAPLSNWLEKNFANSKKMRQQFLYLLLDTSVTFLVMIVLDFVMPTVTIPAISAFLCALFFSGLELFFSRKSPATHQ